MTDRQGSIHENLSPSVQAVRVAVAEDAAVNDHAMIEQRAVAFLNRLELLDEVRELLHVMAVVTAIAFIKLAGDFRQAHEVKAALLFAKLNPAHDHAVF